MKREGHQKERVFFEENNGLERLALALTPTSFHEL
jgi:hypothetical protein